MQCPGTQNGTARITPAAWPRPPGAGLGHAASGREGSVAKRIHHRWSDLFALVLDVEHYPAFVPRCRAVKLFSRRLDDRGRSIILSRMIVGISALEIGYANRTTGDLAARRIEVEALDGPLSHLHAVWTFEPDGEEWTRVGFSVDYGFDSPILAAIASRAFDTLFADIIGAFERRADWLYRVRVADRTSNTGATSAEPPGRHLPAKAANPVTTVLSNISRSQGPAADKQTASAARSRNRPRPSDCLDVMCLLRPSRGTEPQVVRMSTDSHAFSARRK